MDLTSFVIQVVRRFWLFGWLTLPLHLGLQRVCMVTFLALLAIPLHPFTLAYKNNIWS